MNIGKPQRDILITKVKIREEMKELDKTLISDKLKIKVEGLTYYRIHGLTYRIYIDVIINFDDKLRRMYTLFNWI